MKKITVIFFVVFFSLYLPSTLLAAQKTITTYAGDKNIGVSKSSVVPDPPPPIDPPADFPPVVNNPDDPSIVIDPATGAIVLGNGMNDGSGTVWYSGSSPAGTCNPCVNGVCHFGLGFRAYFEFKYLTPDTSANSTAVADGFTFTIINAGNNDISKRGGVPTTAFSLGELMGFAGPGNTTATSSLPRAVPPLDGLGLEPPKMAIEFDTYPNTGAIDDYGCSGGRNDNNNNNHIALLFWGANPTAGTMCSYYSTAGNTYPRASFDDNIHGAGAGTTSNPYNSAYDGNGSGLGGYYERARSTYNWMEDGQYHRVRIEVLRNSSAWTYQVKTWVDCETLTSPYTACPAGEYSYFQDVYSPYNNSSYPPKIDRTQQLSTTLNSLFEQILFGFTEGTGGSTQNISISNFVIYFPTIAISPGSRDHTYSAASGQTVTVSAASGTCTWTAVSNNTSWLTITGGATGTGDGPVTYSISANTGAARTGTITIGGQLFTVNQAAGPPTCTLTASTNIIPYNGTTGLTWNVSGTATSASWIASPGGTCSSPNPAGGSCTTAAQTTAGERTYTLNVTNANGASSCAATVYVGCQGYTVYNNTGSRRDFRITNSSCSRTNNNTAISGALNTGETVTRYNTSNWSCGSAQGSFDYSAAMNVDIVANSGDGDCRVNYNSDDSVGDR